VSGALEGVHSEPQRLVVATRNPGKLAEIRALFEGTGFALESLAEHPFAELPEEGDDYAANALAKAYAVARATGLPALGDDSGLEVDALDGAPGPRSARYGGPDLDDGGRNARLLEALRGVPAERRGARFVCVAAFARPDGSGFTARGACAGRLLDAPRGTGGFGYDPLFVPDGCARTLAELAPAEKNALSHRARAFRALAAELRGRPGEA
jgi:XTP/dITP diphosphohydrolase